MHVSDNEFGPSLARRQIPFNVFEGAFSIFKESFAVRWLRVPFERKEKLKDIL